MTRKRILAKWALPVFLGLLAVSPAMGQEVTYESFMETAGSAFFTISNLWLLIAAGLVLIMHLGFATLESGLTQSKNTVNILFKNVFIICMGTLT